MRRRENRKKKKSLTAGVRHKVRRNPRMRRQDMMSALYPPLQHTRNGMLSLLALAQVETPVKLTIIKCTLPTCISKIKYLI